MRKFLLYIFMGLMISSVGCSKKITLKSPSSGHAKNSTAPGQVKKTTGSQSAKPYAPGQRKKK